MKFPTSFIDAVEAAVIEGQFLPRSSAPDFVQGGFNRCEAVFTIARKGKVTPIGVSYDRTRIAVPAAPKVAVLRETSGNRGEVRVYLYKD